MDISSHSQNTQILVSTASCWLATDLQRHEGNSVTHRELEVAGICCPNRDHYLYKGWPVSKVVTNQAPSCLKSLQIKDFVLCKDLPEFLLMSPQHGASTETAQYRKKVEMVRASFYARGNSLTSSEVSYERTWGFLGLEEKLRWMRKGPGIRKPCQVLAPTADISSSSSSFVLQKLESPGKPFSQPLPHQWSQWHTDQWHWRSLLSSHLLWTSWRAHAGGAGATSCLPCHQPDACSGSGTADQLQYLWPEAYRYKAQSRLAAQRSQSELHSSQAIRRDLPQISCSSLKQRKSVGN